MVAKHYFIIGPSGQSVHLKGPFVSREAAVAWRNQHRPRAACWIMPAEYFGLVEHKPLDEDGKPVQEG